MHAGTVSTDGSALTIITGGDPLTMDGDIHLCGRSDLDPQRHFSGRVAHLQLFDRALSLHEVDNLHESFFQLELPVDAATSSAPFEQTMPYNETTLSGAQCELPFVYRGLLHSDCVAVGALSHFTTVLGPC